MGKKEGKIICPDDKTQMALNRVAPNLTLLQMLKRICTGFWLYLKIITTLFKKITKFKDYHAVSKISTDAKNFSVMIKKCFLHNFLSRSVMKT